MPGIGNVHISSLRIPCNLIPHLRLRDILKIIVFISLIIYYNYGTSLKIRETLNLTKLVN